MSVGCLRGEGDVCCDLVCGGGWGMGVVIVTVLPICIKMVMIGV